MEVDYHYDDDGKLLESQVTDFYFHDQWRLVNSYDQNGHPIKTVKFLNDFEVQIIFTAYDQFGHLIEYQHYGDESSRKFKYQNNGKYIKAKAELFYGNGEQQQHWIFVRKNGSNKLQQKIGPYRFFNDGHYLGLRYANSLFEYNEMDEIFSDYHCQKAYQFIHFDEPQAYARNLIPDGKILSYFAKEYDINFPLNNQPVYSWDYIQHIYEYDENDNLTRDIYAFRDSILIADTTITSDWKTYGQNYYYYDDVNNCTTIVLQFREIEN